MIPSEPGLFGLDFLDAVHSYREECPLAPGARPIGASPGVFPVRRASQLLARDGRRIPPTDGPATVSHARTQTSSIRQSTPRLNGNSVPRGVPAKSAPPSAFYEPRRLQAAAGWLS